MFYNLKITIRNLRRNGIYSLINMGGLAVGLAAVIIIAIWVENELTFDRWYKNSDRLYLAGVSSSNDFFPLGSSEPLLRTLQTEFPEVKRVSHFSTETNVILFPSEDDNIGFNEVGAWVDSTIFGMLDVKFVRGTAQTAFQTPYTIILSEGLAKKIFGKDDPMGKTLRVGNNAEWHQVAGIFKEQPKNSSFQFQWLMPFDVFAIRNAESGFNPRNDWNTTYFRCVVELHKEVDFAAFSEKLKEIKNERTGNSRNIFLYPVSKLYLYGEFVDGVPVASKRVREIKELSFIAVIILLIACINFMNLATARSEKRMIEMGVRKTFGARRAQLIWQMMRESALLTFSSLVLALAAIWITLPLFNRFWDVDLSVYLWNVKHFCVILMVGIVCTVLSGIYPAFYVSAFSPNDILKKLKNRSSNSAALVRRVLVTFQFAASYVLICLTLAVFLQIQLGRNRPLGFDKEHLLRVGGVTEITSRFPVREELAKSALVKATALANDPLVLTGNSGTGYQWQGKSPDINPTILRSYVSSGYIETIAINMLEGRDFYEGSESDARSIIINKTMANMMGDEGKINGELWVGNRENAIIHTIVGIMDNYICGNFYKINSEPLILHKDVGRMSMPCIYVRFNSNVDVGSAMEIVQTTLSQFPNSRPVEYAFVDDLVNSMFDAQRQEGFLVMLFAILSVFVSCLGLFGLVTYIAETKTKEIGIRKILGASVGSLIIMLTREFLILVAASALVAFPLSYWWIDKMLQNYEYRISAGWEIFTAALLITSVLTMLTVGWQARKAATENPVKALKVE